MAVKTFDKIQDELIRLHDINGLKWREIAAMERWRGIPAGSLCSMYHGWEPRTAGLRVRLGLPALGVAPVCVRCGVVHVTKKCVRYQVSRARRDLWDWPGELLRKAMDERTEY